MEGEVIAGIVGAIAGALLANSLNTIGTRKKAAQDLILEYYANVFWKHAQAVTVLKDNALEHPLDEKRNGKALNEIKVVNNWFEMLLHLSNDQVGLVNRKVLEQAGLIEIATRYACDLVGAKYEISEDWPELNSTRSICKCNSSK